MCASNQIRFLKYRKSTLCVAGPCYESCEALPREDVRSWDEEQVITGYPIDGAMGSSGGGQVRKLSVVCLHNNAIVARGILVIILHCGTPELRLSAIYIVSCF